MTDTIGLALRRLLESRPAGAEGGFVIFGGERPSDFVQFSLEPNGLLLNWPTFQDSGTERLPRFVSVLTARGFVDRGNVASGPSRDRIQALGMKELLVADDGLYAQCGRDPIQLESLTRLLLKEIFQVTEVPLQRISTGDHRSTLLSRLSAGPARWILFVLSWVMVIAFAKYGFPKWFTIGLPMAAFIAMAAWLVRDWRLARPRAKAAGTSAGGLPTAPCPRCRGTLEEGSLLVGGPVQWSVEPKVSLLPRSVLASQSYPEAFRAFRCRSCRRCEVPTDAYCAHRFEDGWIFPHAKLRWVNRDPDEVPRFFRPFGSVVAETLFAPGFQWTASGLRCPARKCSACDGLEILYGPHGASIRPS